MKKRIIALSLILSFGPITPLKATSPKIFPLSKIDQFFNTLQNNERSNRALKGAQPVFALLTAAGICTTLTCLSSIPTYRPECSYNKMDAYILKSASVLAASGTALCTYIWKQILKKRMQFSNHEKELLPFFIMDLFERIASIKVVFNLGR